MENLQRHAFGKAADDFRAVLAVVPGDPGLRDRSAVYLALCERELAKRPVVPRTLEERLVGATAALNDEDDLKAEVLARDVLREAPNHELALYLVAAVEARRGALDRALQYLAQAIHASPEIRAQARHDADFEELRGLEAFRQLIDVPPAYLTAGGRRSRRGRVER